MGITVTPFLEGFGAKLTDVGPLAQIDDATFAEVRTAFDVHSVVVLPGQPLDDQEQTDFSARFGPLEKTVVANPARGTVFARQSNLDMKTGEVIPADDRRMEYQKGNMLWHADSTFKPTPALCSLLSAREVPPVGGATEFASTRTLYDRLSDVERTVVEDLVVEHSVVFSRSTVGFTFSEEEAAKMPWARHKLVRVNPATGASSLLIGAHASHIVGWPVEKGRALLSDFLARATEDDFILRHEWREGDLVIWDNRSSLHRATPYDAERYRRLMQRITVSTGVLSEV
jgi:alpha-ketoglutarate-dependent 2,4-dichlorophenoxyacetate dioxygenase